MYRHLILEAIYDYRVTNSINYKINEFNFILLNASQAIAKKQKSVNNLLRNLRSFKYLTYINIDPSFSCRENVRVQRTISLKVYPVQPDQFQLI